MSLLLTGHFFLLFYKKSLEKAQNHGGMSGYMKIPISTDHENSNKQHLNKTTRRKNDG